MVEKGKGMGSGSGGRLVPMKLFATWEVDRTPSSCMPRLCTLTLTRLTVDHSLGTDLSHMFMAVKMQGSKRTLRSNEIPIPADGLLDTELQLTFSLQYPHFLKTKGNRLHVMLQRRKKYKNRTILGYKTLAQGVVNMSEVLQRATDMELELISNGKEHSEANVAARVQVVGLSSLPVDPDYKPPHPDDSEDEEEFSSNDDGSDSEHMLEAGGGGGGGGGGGSGGGAKAKLPSARQRNLKQRFVNLIRRFKAHEHLHMDPERSELARNLSATETDMDTAEIRQLVEELEDLYDSDREELDTLSISSNPKPSLRPFFSSTRSLSQSGSGPDLPLDFSTPSKSSADSAKPTPKPRH